MDSESVFDKTGILFNETNDDKIFIKVIGVGGGGGNAVNHMYELGIKDVSFAIFNTDIQDLQKSPIPVKVQIGGKLTNGLGAGSKPEIGKQSAEEDEEKIRTILSDGTKMVFVTAGMGGGTGTGAAPVVAKIAKSMNILTVGIVTIPFSFEAKKKFDLAIQGIKEMSENVDALLVIDNRRLQTLYEDFSLGNAFQKADCVLSDAAIGISEIITNTGYVNVDFADVNTIMNNSGVAIMNTGLGSGERRISKAINAAMESPLLKDKNIKGAKRMLININTSHAHEITMQETKELNEFVASIGSQDEFIWGASYDDSVEENVRITLIATGFNIEELIYNTREETPKKEEKTVQLDWGNDATDFTPKTEEPFVLPITDSTPTSAPSQISYDDWNSDDDEDLDTPPRFRKH